MSRDVVDVWDCWYGRVIVDAGDFYWHRGLLLTSRIVDIDDYWHRRFLLTLDYCWRRALLFTSKIIVAAEDYCWPWELLLTWNVVVDVEGYYWCWGCCWRRMFLWMLNAFADILRIIAQQPCVMPATMRDRSNHERYQWLSSDSSNRELFKQSNR